MKQTETSPSVEAVVHTPRGSKTPRAYVSIGVSGRKPTWVRSDVARVILDSPDVVRAALESAESEVSPETSAMVDSIGTDAKHLLEALQALGIDPSKLGAAAGAESAAQVSKPKAATKAAPKAKRSPLADRVASRSRR